MNYEKRAKCKRKLKFIKKKQDKGVGVWGIENFHSVRQMRFGGANPRLTEIKGNTGQKTEITNEKGQRRWGNMFGEN